MLQRGLPSDECMAADTLTSKDIVSDPLGGQVGQDTLPVAVSTSRTTRCSRALHPESIVGAIDSAQPVPDPFAGSLALRVFATTVCMLYAIFVTNHVKQDETGDGSYRDDYQYGQQNLDSLHRSAGTLAGRRRADSAIGPLVAVPIPRSRRSGRVGIPPWRRRLRHNPGTLRGER